jgi:hypothetical protein
LTIIAIGSAIFTYWNLYPYKVMTMKNQYALPVDKPVYQAGDRVFYTLDYCKYMDITGLLIRTISDGISVNYEPMQSNVPLGCHVVKRGDLVIPDFIPSGIYYIKSSSEWQVNPIRKVLMNFRTVPFEVVNKSNDLTQIKNKIEQQDLLQDENLK